MTTIVPWQKKDREWLRQWTNTYRADAMLADQTIQILVEALKTEHQAVLDEWPPDMLVEHRQGQCDVCDLIEACDAPFKQEEGEDEVREISTTGCTCLDDAIGCPIHGDSAAVEREVKHQEAMEKWARRYGELNGAPENEEDR